MSSGTPGYRAITMSVAKVDDVGYVWQEGIPTLYFGAKGFTEVWADKSIRDTRIIPKKRARHHPWWEATGFIHENHLPRVVGDIMRSHHRPTNVHALRL